MNLTLLPAIQKGLNLPSIENIHATLPKHPTKSPWSLRKPESITEIVVHHAGDTGLIRNEALYHIRNRGWYTISYHISIDRGKIYQLNDLLAETSQCKGANAYSIGVCINWNLTLRKPTKFEMDALIGVILSLKALFPNAKVSGHNEIGKRHGYGTACPVISMNKLREDLDDVEESFSYSVSSAADRALAYAVANRIKNLDGKLTHAIWGAEARRKIMKLAPVSAELGLMEATAESIAEAILDQYKASIAADFTDEPFANLLTVCQYAKTVGLL